MTSVQLVPTNIQGQPCGEHSHRARFSDATVERARQLRAVGWTMQAIADEVGASRPTVHDWVSFRRRRPPARVVARRVKTPKQCVVNHQPEVENPAAMRASEVHALADTDDFTDIA